MQTWRFIFSWPGLLMMLTVWFVSQHPVGSAEITVSVASGLVDFAATVLELVGVETRSAQS